MYPITIVDDFFPDPDKIVEYCKTLEFQPDPRGQWPGKRTQTLEVLNPDLNNYICQRILRRWYHTYQMNWGAALTFQMVEPFHDDQYHIQNHGWVHVDDDVKFGGIIYLNKNPEPDTGTSIYKEHNGYAWCQPNDNVLQCSFYRGDKVTDQDYKESYDRFHSQYTETVRVSNVYNRMFCFNNQTPHGMQTFGKNQTRLTLAFFFHEVMGPNPPYHRC